MDLVYGSVGCRLTISCWCHSIFGLSSHLLLIQSVFEARVLKVVKFLNLQRYLLINGLNRNFFLRRQKIKQIFPLQTVLKLFFYGLHTPSNLDAYIALIIDHNINLEFGHIFADLVAILRVTSHHAF